MTRNLPNGKSGIRFVTRSMCCILCLFSVVCFAQDDVSYLYQLKDLGTLGGSLSRATAINNKGWIVGDSETSSGDIRAFVWIPASGMQNLGAIGGKSSRAYDINDHGVVVGESSTRDGETSAFIWNGNETMKPLMSGEESIYSVAFAINNHDQAVGTVETIKGFQAVMWDQEGMRVLPRLPGTGYVQPLDVNDQGDIVGQIQTVAGSVESAVSHAFYFRHALSAAHLSGFKLLSQHSGSAAVAINSKGDSAGYVMANETGVSASRYSRIDDCVLLEDGGALFSSAAAINEIGDMCGSVIAAYTADEKACVWKNGRMLDLNEVTEKDPDWELVHATGMNDHGVITGYGLKGEYERAFVLEPIPGADITSWPEVGVTVAEMTETQDTERILVIQAQANSEAVVEKVDFIIDGELLGTVYDPPYEWGWQGMMEEEHMFSVSMTDKMGRHISSRVISIKPLFK